MRGKRRESFRGFVCTAVPRYTYAITFFNNLPGKSKVCAKSLRTR